MESGASFGLITDAPLCGAGRRGLCAGSGPEHLGGFLEILARAEQAPPGFAAGGERRRFIEELHEAGLGYAGFVYCGAGAGAGAREVLREAGGRRKTFFVFSLGAEGAPQGRLFSWEGRPACRAADICRAEEA
jgi:hypothetical protein